MSPSTVISALVIATLWVAALSWGYRNWRAILFLLGVSAAILIAGWLPLSVSPWVRAALWGQALLVLLFRGELLSPMSRNEYGFVRQYLAALTRIRVLKGRALMTDSSDYVAAFSNIISDLEALSPPAGEWASLHSDAVAELKRRLTMMRLTVDPSRSTLDAGEIRWSEIEARLRSLLRRRAGFWAN